MAAKKDGTSTVRSNDWLSRLSLGDETQDLTHERIPVLLDGIKIGEWRCERVLQRRYGEFDPNEYFRKLAGKPLYTGGESYMICPNLAILLAG